MKKFYFLSTILAALSLLSPLSVGAQDNWYVIGSVGDITITPNNLPQVNKMNGAAIANTGVTDDGCLLWQNIPLTLLGGESQPFIAFSQFENASIINGVFSQPVFVNVDGFKDASVSGEPTTLKEMPKMTNAKSWENWTWVKKSGSYNLKLDVKNPKAPVLYITEGTGTPWGGPEVLPTSCTLAADNLSFPLAADVKEGRFTGVVTLEEAASLRFVTDVDTYGAEGAVSVTPAVCPLSLNLEVDGAALAFDKGTWTLIADFTVAPARVTIQAGVTPTKMQLFSMGIEGWDTPVEYEVENLNSMYYARVEVPEGVLKFKLSATAYDLDGKFSWDVFDAYSVSAPLPKDKFTSDYNVYTLRTELNPSTTDIVLPWSANWSIMVQFNDDTLRPNFMIVNTYNAPPAGFAELYLRTSIDNYDALPDWKFVTNDGEAYALEGVQLPMDTRFKIADADWGSYNFGATQGQVFTLAMPYAMTNGSLDDVVCDIPFRGNVSFTLSTGEVVFLPVSGIDALGADAPEAAPAEFFTLQGARVAEPHSGIFIRRCGAKAEKVVL